MSDPRGFLKFMREMPARRPSQSRILDFREFYEPFSEEKIKSQSARCMDCGVPFCQSTHGCPVENLIPDWNDLVHRGQWREALESLHSTHNFPEFTGKLCPAPCESACVLGINADAVTIRSIESAIIERGFDEGWVTPVIASRLTGRKVAVVGSGPAGLAAAQQLARAGHSVTVFEKSDRVGGLLRYGIPEFKLEKRHLDRRLAQLAAEGVEFKTGVEVGGADLDAHELMSGFDAVCLTLGAEKARELPVPGRELKGVFQAMEYLTAQNREDLSDPDLHARGKRVVIIGGGDTGSDCLGTAHRQGCLSAAQFELLPQPPALRAQTTPWPLWPMQLRTSHAHEEGGDREWNVSTLGFAGENGQVQKLHAQRVAFDGGKFAPVPGSEFELEADLVLLAMGFTGPGANPLFQSLKLKTDPRGNLSVDSGYMTSHKGVFAAGDVRRGASLIVWAIAEGRKMAASVDAFLAGKLTD
jgi:glutamate synthase (NADPH/NADH) small chain